MADYDKLVEALEDSRVSAEFEGQQTLVAKIDEALPLARQLIEENERLKEGRETRIWGSRLASAETRAGEWERRDKHGRDLQSRLSAAEDGAKNAARHHAFVLTQITGRLKRAEEENERLKNERLEYESRERFDRKAIADLQSRLAAVEEENKQLRATLNAVKQQYGSRTVQGYEEGK